MKPSIIVTESVDLMNAYVAELVAANRNATDELLLTKAKLSLADVEITKLKTTLGDVTKKLDALTPPQSDTPAEPVLLLEETPNSKNI